jgi:heme-degrading monooxygenase HmoA
MNVPGEAAQKFEQEWARVARWVAEQDGCLRQTLSRVRDAHEPVYVISSDWADLPTYRRFEHSPLQDEMTAGLRALRTGARMEIVAILDHRERVTTASRAAATGTTVSGKDADG